MRRTSSISQHSLHNSGHNASGSSTANQNNAIVQNNILNGGLLPSNNLNEPMAEQTTLGQSNGFVLSTIERGRRGRASGYFGHDELHPNALHGSHAKINHHRSSSFTRLNGTLERRRKSRTDLLAAVEGGTLGRTGGIGGECEPMLTIGRCNGGPANGGHGVAAGAVIMQSSC